MRESPPSPGLQGYNATVWGTIQSVDDSPKMQRVDARGLNGETFTGIERPQTYGFTSVPLPPDGSGPGAAEVEIGFRAGNRSHPYVRSTDDRRYRFKNCKPGENAQYDDQGQNHHIARDGIKSTAKSHVLSATEGSQPLTTFELNDQLKGLGARMSHMEHSHHGLFDVTSRMREMVQALVPSLAALAPILSQTPAGLTQMTEAIAGTEPAYLQQHIQDALAKFLDPTIGGVVSILGGQDTIIAALQAQIASLIAANPVVSTVTGLQQELAALQSSGSPATVAAMAPVIQGLIDSAIATNPVVGQVAQLQSQLAGLISTAGDGLNFLGPQQRIPQRLTKSLRLSQ